MVDIQEVEQKFFEGMMEGWATDAAKNGTAKYARRTSSPLFPGYKIIEWRKDDWLVIDCYGGRPDSPKSHGLTLIYFQDTPTWVMYYLGWFKRGVIPFVKRALAENYQRGVFLGGRGPETYTEGSLVYRNYPRRIAFFDFCGSEEVVEPKTSPVTQWGYHEYRGYSLLLPESLWEGTPDPKKVLRGVEQRADKAQKSLEELNRNSLVGRAPSCRCRDRRRNPNCPVHRVIG